jgi:hypothetical protein
MILNCQQTELKLVKMVWISIAEIHTHTHIELHLLEM